ncbi:MAG: hypothetical protein A2X08_14965 [Bacteroidetes bacterium GWA2_32_17]|nr:MAG: hypothetical protein A2X08_14965 [Bacteroidetes bacterium GWA2_32_17]
MRNQNVLNESFNQSIIDLVWQKATVVPGYDSNVYRKDHCGAWIKKSMHGNANPLSMGWEIDHIKPKSIEKNDELSNLQPLQWENNKGKSDDYPKWLCTVTSDGNLKNKYII